MYTYFTEYRKCISLRLIMDLLTLGIALILTVISYLIFPIIYVKKNGKVSENLGKKLALWNSIICALIFFIVGFCIGLEPSTNSTMFAPAFFYYFIAKSILIDKTITNDKPISNNTKNSTNIVENNSYSICPKCGMQIFDDEDKCSNCGYVFDKQEDIIEEESLDDGVGSNNTKSCEKQNNKTSISLFKESIVKMQKAVVAIFCFFIAFSVFYPIIACSIRDSKIPSENTCKITSLNRLDADQTVYLNSKGSINFVYIKQNGQIVIYRFANTSMYNSSGGVRSGYATTQQIKSQFANIKTGKPSISFVTPATSIIGWLLGISFVVSLITLFVLIHKKSEEDLFNLTKKDETLLDLKTKFKNDDISLSTYKSKKRQYYSECIIENNKFYSIFKILY